MLTGSQEAAAAPPLLLALVTAAVVPLGQRLVAYRLRNVYRDTDGVVYGLDLYSLATLSVVIPIIGIFVAPHATANLGIVAVAYLVAFVGNLAALIVVLTTPDHHRYVTTRRIAYWSYPTCLTLATMFGSAILVELLS